jgi:hypothetical protein
MALFGQPFHSRELRSGSLDCQDQATVYGLSFHQDGTGATIAVVATFLGSG